MNNESMYNTFVKNRANSETQPEKPKRIPPRVTEVTLPDFDFDTEDVLEDPESVDDKREPVGVNSSLGNLTDYLNHNADTAYNGVEEPRPNLDELEAEYSSSKPNFAENTYTEPFTFEDGAVTLPSPEIFNAYPPEVQRKIMEWTDRDFRARREDESRRQDAILRANITRDRNKTAIPVLIIVLSIISALIVGIYTRNPVFSIAFLVVAIVVIITVAVAKFHKNQSKKRSPYAKR